jgi:bifunctional aspartokinase / homoserine dehydrogenase 1
MKILKFGGSSIGTPERIRSVVNIIKKSKKEHGEIAVVVSAMEGVTNQLVDVSKQAFRGSQNYENILKELENRHMAAADELLGKNKNSQSHRFIAQSFHELQEFIHGIWILGEITDRTLDYVMSYGEKLSCAIIADVLNQSGLSAEYVDSRILIRTDLTYGSAQVDFTVTNWNILNHFKNKTALQIVTGFIACGPDNETTTLGRGGSDFTASILGSALDAKEIEIWTDVDGVMTADPRKVHSALSLEALTFEEALELSHFGAKVIHAPTMLPALHKRIPIRIRNTFHEQFTGTLISDQPSSLQRSSVKGIACIDKISLLKVTGEGILRTVGIASRIFAALARKDIEVTLITQSSSEHSICLAIASENIRTAREVVELEFRVELHHGQISGIIVESDCSMIAVVSEQVHNIPGVTGQVFETLGRNGIKPRAIAYGSSERNLALVLRQTDLQKGMNALHDNLFLSQQKTLNVFLLGPGLVGSALLELLQDQEEYARTTLHTCFKVAGIANSRKMIFNQQGIDLTQWRKLLADSTQASDPQEFVNQVQQFNAANSIVIDCTGVESAVQQYLSLLTASVSIITSSKLANTLSYDFYQQLRIISAQHGVQFRYSTNVGAALPIIDSIKSIVHNGDSVERIEAVLSGTLSFIFNNLNAGKKFSDAVREAQQFGYSEPDPRQDLSGMDIARKLLILVREAGFQMEMGDIVIEPYLPQHFFLETDIELALHEADKVLEYKKAIAKKNGCSLMVIAEFENHQGRIGLKEISPDHPFYHLSGNDNIVSLTTRSLYRQPLVVRGGGAGAKLTASGIFNDIINISHTMN